MTKEGETPKYTTQDLIGDLVDKPIDGMGKETVTAEGAGEQQIQEGSGDNKAGADSQAKGAGTGAGTGANVFVPKYKDVWDKFKEDGIDVPKEYMEGKFGDDVTEFDAIRSLMVENTETGYDDPFILAYAATPAEKRPEFLQAHYDTLNFLNLNPEAGVRRWYEMQKKEDKTTIKYSKDEIDKYMNGKSIIELEKEWTGIQGSVQKGMEQYYSKFTPSAEERMADIEVINNDLDIRSDTVTAELAKMEKYGDIVLTPEFKETFSAKFKALSRINPRTGSPYIMNLIGDDKVLMNMVMAYELFNSGQVDAFLSNFKEDYKDDLLKNKLRVKQKPIETSSQFKVAMTTEDYK